MIRFLFYTLLVGLFLSSCTQKSSNETHSATNDSVKKYLDLASDKTIAFDKRIKYNDKAFTLLNLNQNDSISSYYLYCISYKYYSFNKFNNVKSTADMLMNLALKSNDTLNIGRANRNLGLYYMSISDNEKAIRYFFKAKKTFKLIGRNDYVIKVMDNIATTQYYASDFFGSNKTSIEMISLSKKASLTKLNPSAFLNIRHNLSSLKNYNQAIVYYKKVSGVESEKESVNYNLSNCYMKLREYDTAFKYINKNLENKKLIYTDPLSYASALSLNAIIQLKRGKYSKLEKKFNLADYYFKRFNSPSGRNYNQIYLSMYYEEINNNSKAIKAAQKAYLLSISYKNATDILASLEQLINVDKFNASKNAKEYIRLNDSMQIAERQFRDNFARIAYETDEIAQEKEKAISQKWIVIGVSGFIILIIVLLLIITRQRTKQKELQLLQSQQKANEEIYDLMLSQKGIEEEARQNEKKRIAIELHDGVMNKLASTRLNLDVLHHKIDAQTVKECLGHIKEIYKIEQEIRNISHDLSLDIFKSNNSFKGLIEDFLNTQNKTYVTHFKLEMEDTIKWENISSSIKMNLFRIIQEASHNINKFANAKNAVITFIIDTNNLCLSVTDDGQGFDVENQTEGIGLKNIKQRVESLKGKCIIQSINNHSTSINIAIPL